MPTVKQWLDGLLTVAMLVLIAMLGWRLVQSPARAPEPLPDAPVSLSGVQLRGNPDALWTLLVYEDFRCAACQIFEREAMPVLLRDYIDTGVVALAVQNMPLATNGETAALEARLAGCAAVQGKFWEFREAMFGRDVPIVAGLPDVVEKIPGLNEADLRSCAETEGARRTTVQAVERARKAGLRGTPLFLLGRADNGHLTVTAVKQGIGQGSLWLKQWLDGEIQ